MKINHVFISYMPERIKGMKKKIITIVVSILVIIAIACYIYVLSGTKKAETLMWEYLETKGYAIEEIDNIHVRHSFLNIILSYNEWIIKVQYADEPNAIYSYAIKDGQIRENGISGNVNKEELKHIH